MLSGSSWLLPCKVNLANAYCALGMCAAALSAMLRLSSWLFLQVTHRLEELQWADTASYMEQGKIQFTGPAQEVAKYMKSLGAH